MLPLLKQQGEFSMHGVDFFRKIRNKFVYMRNIFYLCSRIQLKAPNSPTRLVGDPNREAR